MAKKKAKKKPKQPRNWQAVNAQFRNSAGAMKDKRKQQEPDWASEWLDELASKEKKDEHQ